MGENSSVFTIAERTVFLFAAIGVFATTYALVCFIGNHVRFVW